MGIGLYVVKSRILRLFLLQCVKQNHRSQKTIISQKLRISNKEILFGSVADERNQSDNYEASRNRFQLPARKPCEYLRQGLREVLRLITPYGSRRLLFGSYLLHVR